MYEKLPNLVIGFHGCSMETYHNVIVKQQELKASDNAYDWLGNGIYFWENNLQRAEEWAVRRYGENAAVIGAVIDLGSCLNLTDSASADELKRGYNVLKARCEYAGTELPQNKPSPKTKDILLRNLDCAVIQQIQDFPRIDLEESGHEGIHEKIQPKYDSVRGVFIEGGPPYPGSAFCEKTHVQICVCNPNCIKGYFEPRERNMDYRLP